MSKELVNGLQQVQINLLSKLLSECIYNMDGSMTIPADVVDRLLTICRAPTASRDRLLTVLEPVLGQDFCFPEE